MCKIHWIRECLCFLYPRVFGLNMEIWRQLSVILCIQSIYATIWKFENILYSCVPYTEKRVFMSIQAHALFLCIYIYMYIYYMAIDLYIICIFMYILHIIHIYISITYINISILYICLYLYIYMYIYTYIHIYIYIHIFIYVYTHAQLVDSNRFDLSELISTA